MLDAVAAAIYDHFSAQYRRAREMPRPWIYGRCAYDDLSQRRNSLDDRFLWVAWDFVKFENLILARKKTGGRASSSVASSSVASVVLYQIHFTEEHLTRTRVYMYTRFIPMILPISFISSGIFFTFLNETECSHVGIHEISRFSDGSFI
jgi:hypothetical protein